MEEASATQRCYVSHQPGINDLEAAADRQDHEGEETHGNQLPYEVRFHQHGFAEHQWR